MNTAQFKVGDEVAIDPGCLDGHFFEQDRPQFEAAGWVGVIAECSVWSVCQWRVGSLWFRADELTLLASPASGDTDVDDGSE